MHVRAYAYIRTLGADGLRAVSENAVLNANYLMKRAARATMTSRRPAPACTSSCCPRVGRRSTACHASTSPSACSTTASTPPTIYFPLIVEEALMIEPTETEIEGDARRVLRGDDPDREGGGERSAPDPRGAGDDAGAPPRPDQGRARAQSEVASQGLGAADAAIQRVDRRPAALLFDFGGTLDGPGLTWKARAIRLYRSAGLDHADFDRVFYAADDALVGAIPATLGLDETVHRLFTGISAGLGVANDRLTARLADRFIEDARTSLRDSGRVLARLSRRHRLGVVSNFYGNLGAVCADAGLTALLGVIADSTAVGWTKPDPADLPSRPRRALRRARGGRVRR